MIRLLLLLGLEFYTFYSFSQTAILKGIIHDSVTGQTIPGASVLNLSDTKFAIADENGNYSLSISPGVNKIVCSFIGMRNDTVEINGNDGGTIFHNFNLSTASVMLNLVVVSAGKFEQKVEDLTVSMEVLKPHLAESRNSTNITDALEQVPGLTILDGEPQIRSGSGFSFGVGSRCAILIDGLPVLLGDQGRPEWSFLPIENMEQIEIIKGAASVLYGSSALSGVINLRTAFPSEQPETKITTYYGQYDSPSAAGSKWWKGTASFYGLSFLHSQQFGKTKNIDLVIGGQGLYDHNFIGLPKKVSYVHIPVDSTLTDDDAATKTGRLNFNLRFRPVHLKNLSFGINGNFMESIDNYSLIWLNDSNGLYRAFPGTLTLSDMLMYYLDPFVNYFTPSGLKHTLRFRVFHNNAQNGNDQSTRSTVYYSEYQFYKELTSVNELHITGGLIMNNVRAHAQLYAGSGNPDQKLDNYSGYLQLDKKIKKHLNVSIGFRAEYYDINKSENVLRPIFRGGLSYSLTKGTFLRMSYGQGYRYPTITEKFIYTSTGGIKVLPNPLLSPETSRSIELGLKQGFKIGNFLGFADASVFHENYVNTIEYIYANWGYDSTGFKFVNTGNTKVSGYEFTLMGNGKIWNELDLSVFAGYTYTQPKADDPDYVFATENPRPPLRPKQLSYNNTSTDTTDDILKYRFEHTVKADVELSWTFISAGFSMRYYSFMKNIDQTFYEIDNDFILPTGIKKYRAGHSNGTIVYDVRLHVNFNKHIGVSFIINNVENKSYSLRPLKIESPRTFTLQVTVKF